MNYPSIKEYKEAILFAEDNFEQLKNLRPVLEDDGSPVMTSGNFAVVFKMKDEQTGKLHAVKCFLREQEGRAEAYRQIAEELEYVSSTFLTPIKYLEKELFVDTNAGEESEFPVLLMDWVEGVTLDKYIRKHLDDQYELSLLAYQFSRLAMWLMPQPFAHGDLKPDNILVKSDGTLVLVDYDGMYVPAMKGQRARELGSPDFRHPSRTETDFDEHIDDFSLASILLSLKAISLQSSLLEEYGAQDRLLFSEKDYRNLSESKVMDALKPLMQDAELASLYSLFILAASQNNLSGVSFRLFYLNRPSVSSPKKSLRVLQINKKIVNQSDNKIIKKELLSTFQGKKNVWHIVASNGTSSYLTQERSFSDETYAKGACKLNTVENETKHVLFLFNDRDAEVGRYYIGKKLQGLTPTQLTEIKHELCFFESWNPETKKWVPCVGKVKVTDEDKEFIEKYGKTKSEYLKENFNEVNTLTAVCLKNVYDFYQHEDYSELEVGKSYQITYIGVFRSYTRIMLNGFGYKQYNSTCFEIFENGESISDKYSKDFRFWAPYLRERLNIKEPSNNRIEDNLSTEVTDEDLAKGKEILLWGGGIYSQDNSRLLVAPKNVKNFSIGEGVKVICDGAFNRCYDLENVFLPNSVKKIGKVAFSHCFALKTISIPEGVTSIDDYAFSKCINLESISIPQSVSCVGKLLFRYCDNLASIMIPKGTMSLFEELLPDYKHKLVEHLEEEKLSTIISDEDLEKAWTDEYGVMYSADRKRLLKAPKDIEEYSIKEGTKVICNGFSSKYDWGRNVTGAFKDCTSLRSLSIPDSVTKIGNVAFGGCDSLTKLSIPNSVKEIGSRAFINCGIKLLTIPDGITKIEDETFYGCEDLTTLIIPNSVSYIGDNVLGNCDFVETIYVPLGSKSKFEALLSDEFENKIVENDDFVYAWSDSFGVKYSPDKKRLLKAPDEIKEYSTIESTHIIKREAFKSCYDLKSIIITDNVIEIENDAFSDCNKLTYVKMSNSILKIGESAFQSCSFSSIVLSGSILEIGNFSFFQSKLVSVFIPQSIKKIHGNPFSFCDCLKKIEVDKKNPYYDSRNKCNAIIETQNNILVSSCQSTTIPDTVRTIGDYAFYFTDFTSVIIPNSVIRIGNYAYSCSKITSLIIPDSVIEIGEESFSYCQKLISVTLSNNIVKIPIRAFSWCTKITSVTIPSGVQKISFGAFEGCEELTSIYLPESLIEIDSRAFWGCTNLRTIIIPPSVDKIAKDSLGQCHLDSIIIPFGTRDKFEKLLPEYRYKLVEQ